tara:strand:- start:6 stop:383 length:378 start_codon:yes stop_codon:yes gene_type:complete
MSTHTVEVLNRSQHSNSQWEEELGFDPTQPSMKLREFVQKVAWENDVAFQPIEGEQGYEGWMRYVINISPPHDEHADDEHADGDPDRPCVRCGESESDDTDPGGCCNICDQCSLCCECGTFKEEE